jgi:hypothetical protein
LAYVLKPENQEEMHKQLLVSSFPSTQVDFSNLSSYANNFPTFVRAVYVYIDRYEDKVDLLTHFSDEFFPTNIFRKQDVLGQVDYFLAPFPSKDFATRVRKHISVQVAKNIKTFDEFLVHFLKILEKLEKHFKVDRKLVDTLVYGPSSEKPSPFAKKVEPSRTARFQKVNVLDDSTDTLINDEFVHELLEENGATNDDSEQDLLEEDLLDSLPDEEDEFGNDVSYESTGIPDPDIELSPALNVLEAPKPPAIQVCYAKVNHGVCSNKECKYSHDDAVIAKFKTQYKDRQKNKKTSFQPNSKNPTSTPNRKFGGDGKRRA